MRKGNLGKSAGEPVASAQKACSKHPVDGAASAQEACSKHPVPVGLSYLLAVVSGLALALAMPRPGIWLLAWFGLAPLLVAIRGARAGQAALAGFVSGLAYFSVVLSWVSVFGYLPWALLSMLEAAHIAVFAVIAARVMRTRTGAWRYIAVPAAWTALQWTRSLGMFGFTWGSLAHTQAANLPIAQLASLTGPWGIDFLVCLVNLALADALSELWSPSPQPSPARGEGACSPAYAGGEGAHGPAPAVVSIALALAIGAAGWTAMARADLPRPKTRIAIIQGSIRQDAVADPNYLVRAFSLYDRMSRQAARRKPDFIIWPETTLPTVIAEPGWGTLVSELARETHAGFIVGGYDRADDPSVALSHNAAHFYDRTGRKLGVYRKVRLVPYGEFVPLRDRLPFLRRYRIRDQDVLPGKRHVLIPTQIGRLGVAICFESLFPDISRRAVKRGAVMLVVITNDSWFERTHAARQHMMMAKLRAIECRRYVARAAATGISAIIDPFGRTVAELGIFRRGIVAGTVAPMRVSTPYVRWGEWFVYLCLAIVLAGYMPWPRRKIPSGK